MWTTLQHWSRKLIHCCKQRLVGHFSRSPKDKSVVLDHEISEENKVLISNRVVGYKCDTLTKDLVDFFSWPKNFPETNTKRNGVISLADKFQLVWLLLVTTWLSLAILLSIYD